MAFTALVTSGPTHEPIDPVRYIGNYSSGKQGHAIAASLAREGFQVTLVSGPVQLADPPGVRTVHVQTAQDMLAACEDALPVDVAVCAAAVADWRPVLVAGQKIKKDGAPPVIQLTENPDILRQLSVHRQRPRLVVGFAAETQEVLVHARAKRLRKGCDWMLANSVAGGAVFAEDENEVTWISASQEEQWPRMTKQAIAERLARAIQSTLMKG